MSIFETAKDTDELRTSPNAVTKQISDITRATNKHDWSKYTEVFEKTAHSWVQGIYTPNITELIPDSGVNRVL